MKTYKITRTYAYTLEATIEANSGEEAEDIFDGMATDELKEEYLGRAASFDELPDKIEELKNS